MTRAFILSSWRRFSLGKKKKRKKKKKKKREYSPLHGTHVPPFQQNFTPVFSKFFPISSAVFTSLSFVSSRPIICEADHFLGSLRAPARAADALDADAAFTVH